MKIRIPFFLIALFLAFQMNGQCPPPGYPPASDDCPTAPTLCVDLDGYCDQLSSINTQQQFPGCPSNALNNDTWFAFIAGSTSITIEVIPSNCQFAPPTNGMQGAIYEGSCTGAVMATQCGCTTNTFLLSATNFIPGQSYYIVFDGCAGDICDFEVNVLVGSTLPVPPADPGPILGPTQVCPGATTDYTLNVPNGATYTWILSPPSIGTINPNPGAPTSITWNTQGTATLCVTASNPCFINPTPSCVTITSTSLPPAHQYYDICVGDCIPCAGTQFCAPTGPNGTPVTLQSWLGCDSVIICHIDGINIPPTNAGQQTFCAPHTYTVCGNNFTESGIYSVTCQSYQGCDSIVNVDLAIFTPNANIAQPPPVLDCGANSFVVLDGIGSSYPLVPNGDISFLWTGPGIMGANNDAIVQVNQPGQYCLTVTHIRNGVQCSNTECVTVIQNTAVPQQPTLTGNATPCEGATVTYTVAPVGTPAPSTYTWTTPNGEPVIPVNNTTVQVVWTTDMGGPLCVTANNACGSSTPACLNINVGEAPNAPVITGPTSACANNQTQTYSVSNVQTGVMYAWTVNNGASFSGSGSSINVNFSGATGTVNVCVTASNPCGSEGPVCVAVPITSPALAPTMTGPASVCNNGGGYNYVVSSPQPGVTFNWTAPPPAVITGSGPNVSINFAGAPSGQVCVSATNACGTSQLTCQAVTVVADSVATISGGGDFCEGSGGTVNLTINVTGSGPWNATYTVNQANPTNITINSSPHTLTVSQAGVYELTAVSGSAGCNGSVMGSATVVENPLPEATLSGSGSICAGSGDQVPLTIDLTGTAPWEVCWEVNGNAQAPLIINSTPYTLNIGQPQAGDITISCVSDDNDCVGTASGMATVAIESAPTVSMIQTPCDVTNTAYTVNFTVNGGDPSSYEVIPSTGTWNGNVFTSDPITSGTSYSFGVTDGNACDTVMVTGIRICDCTSAAGTTDLTPIQVCGNGPQPVPFNSNGQFLDGNDIPVFVLHSGSGASIVAPVIGQYALPSVSFVPASMTYGTTYYLSAVVGNDDGTGDVDLNDPCLAVSQGTPITFYQVPTATLSGTPVICEGENATMTVNFTGNGPWSITYDAGNGLQTLNGINANPYNLVITPASSATVCLTNMTDQNCTGTASGCSDVTVNTGVSYSNLMTTCNLTATAYVITFDAAGGDPSSYFVTGVNGTFMNGVFTSEELPTGSGFSLVFDDANGCSPQTIAQGIVVCDCETDAGQMTTTLLSYCGDGPTDNVMDADGTVLDADDIFQYILHTASSNTLGTVIATNSTPVFSFDPGTMQYGTTYYISAVAGNDDGTGNIDVTDPCFDLAPGSPVVFYEIPTADISGGTEVCPGEMASLTIDLTGDSPWSVTVNGTVIPNINNTPYTYNVTPAATTTYNLTLVEDEHCQNAIIDAETVTVHVPPVFDSVGVACNLTGTAFTVTMNIADGDPSCYQVTPANGTLTGNQFVSNEIPAGQGYDFQLTDCHGCPADVASEPLVDCNCLSMAGDMTSAPMSICGSTMAMPTYDPTNEFFDADDVLCFMIHNGNNVPIATNPNAPNFSYAPGLMNYGQTYYICAVVGNDNGSGCVAQNDPCRSIGACAEVVFHAIPTAVLSGTTNICSGETANLNVVLTGQGPWNITYVNAGGNNVTLTANSSPFTFPVSPPTSTVYQITNLTDANCTGTSNGNATVSVNSPPQAINEIVTCDPTGVTFTVSFDIVGGDLSTYTVTPAGTLTGNSYTSNPINSGQTYLFNVDDANGCGPFVVDGAFACNCLSDAGTMNTTLTEFCVGDVPNIPPTSGQVLDPNDVLVYVLHTNSGGTLGTVIASANNPNFTFNPGTMTTGVTYYVSAVVGNNNGSGSYDPSDLCLDVAPGTPIVFNAIPTLAISGTTSICEGEQATVTLTMTGEAPFTVTFTQNGAQQTVPGLPASFNITQAFQQTTTFTLVSVMDANGCQNTANQTVTVTVNPPVSAGQALGDLEFCQSDPTTVDLDNQLTGADPGGTWTGPNGQTVPGGNLSIASLVPGTYPYTYTVTGTPPCADDEEIVTITVEPQPNADAGSDQALDCDVSMVTLGGNGTTPGLTYNWTDNATGNSIGSTPTLPTTEPGSFTLTVTTTFGCSDSDVVQVSQTISEPVPHITVSDVSCFGDSDGYIVLDSISGGIAPYLCSFNGGPFIAQKQFVSLSPGDYNIVIEDNAGCETTLEFSIGEPDEVTVEIEGDFAGLDPVIKLGETVTLSIFSNPPVGSLDTIIWSSGGIDSCNTCPKIEVMPVEQTTYSIRVEEEGCPATDRITVFVSKDRPVFIPNAFTPNDDGPNDIFRIYAGKSVDKIKSFVVFNRWGESVYEFFNFDPNDLTVGWDGSHRGEKLNPQVLTYFVEVVFIDGSVELYEGDVMLIR